MAQGFDGELVFNTRVDTDGFERGSNTIRHQADGLRNALSGLAKYFSFAFIVGGLVRISKQAVETASDLAEVQNVVDTSFGSMADKIENFSKSCVEMYGISELTAKQTASTFMSMAKGMDVAADSASDMAVNLTARMGDMMSFYNQTAEITSTALNGIYTGETEALKKFGVVMTEANLQQFAYEQGITKAISKMSQAEKVTLRYNFVMSKTALAQGDFAKTSDGWANSTRVLHEEFKALLGTIGNGLIKVFTPALRVINSFLTSIIGLANTIGEIFSDIFGTTKNVYTVTQKLDDSTVSASEGLSSIGDSVKDSSKSINKSIAPFDELNQIASDMADNTKVAGGGIGSVADSVGVVKDAASGGGKLNDVVKEAKEGIDGLGVALVGLATTFGTYEILTHFGKLTSLIGTLTTSPAGIIALAVGGLAMLGTALYQLWKDAKLKDLNERFGDVTLSIEEMREVAQSIIDNGTMEKLATVSSEWADLDGIQEEIDGAVQKLNKLNWKVGIGMKLSPEDEEQYKQAIKEYIEKSQKYVYEQKEAVLLTFDFIMSDSETKDNIMKKTDMFYNNVQSQLKSLGEKLSDTVNEAWADDLLTIDESEKIQQIQSQMNSIMKKIALSDLTADIEMLKIKYSGVDLTAETYQELSEMIDSRVQKYIDDNDAAEAKGIAILDMEVREGIIDTDDYELAIEDIKKKRLSDIGTVELYASQFKMNTVVDAFKNEFSKEMPNIKQSIDDGLEQWFDTGLIEDHATTFFGMMADYISDGYGDLDIVVGSNLDEMITMMKPDDKIMQSLKEDWIKRGETVPKGLSQGITSMNQLKAIRGDMDAIYYMIGVQAGKSPKYAEMLKRMIKDGKKIPDKVIEGMNAKDDKVAASVEELFKLIESTTQDQSKLLNKVIGDTGKGIVTSFTDKMRKAFPNIKLVVSDFYAEIKKEMEKQQIPGIQLGVADARIALHNTKIPGYATGTVVPANYGKFLGVLGDNTREPEVVSPLSTMKQAFKEAIAESGNVNNGGTAHFTLNLNGRNLLEGMVEADNERSKSTGYKLLNN